MTVYDLHPRVILELMPLPEEIRPAVARRRGRTTLIWADPESLRVETAFWTMETLTEAERTVIRRAYGMNQHLQVPPDDALVTGRNCDGPPVPPALRAPDRWQLTDAAG